MGGMDFILSHGIRVPLHSTTLQIDFFTSKQSFVKIFLQRNFLAQSLHVHANAKHILKSKMLQPQNVEMC